MSGKGLIGLGLAAAGIIYVATRAKAAPPPEEPPIEEGDFINGVQIGVGLTAEDGHSISYVPSGPVGRGPVGALVNGGYYISADDCGTTGVTITVTVTNKSTKGGVPWPATLACKIQGNSGGDGRGIILVPTQTQSQSFTAGESKQFTAKFGALDASRSVDANGNMNVYLYSGTSATGIPFASDMATFDFRVFLPVYSLTATKPSSATVAEGAGAVNVPFTFTNTSTKGAYSGKTIVNNPVAIPINTLKFSLFSNTSALGKAAGYYANSYVLNPGAISAGGTWNASLQLYSSVVGDAGVSGDSGSLSWSVLDLSQTPNPTAASGAGDIAFTVTYNQIIYDATIVWV